MAYTTIDNIEARLGNSLTTEQSTYFTSVLSDAVDKYIDQMAETTFAGGGPIDVYVSGTGSNILVIPTMNSISAINLIDDDGTTTLIDSSNYVTYPRSLDNVYSIRLLSGVWQCGIENYKVTGVLGYKDVPADITLVATELACIGLNNTNNYKSEKVGDWSVTYADSEQTLSSDSIDILNSYQRLSRSI